MAITGAQETAVAIKTCTLYPAGKNNDTGSKCLSDHSLWVLIFSKSIKATILYSFALNTALNTDTYFYVNIHRT